MVSIIISACLLADPKVCRDYRVPLNESYDPARCYLYAQPHFAKWAAEHPAWDIKKWKCVDNDVKDL